MLKVLVADDEQKVCQLIVNIIDWKEYGFEIIGVVGDGLSAYKFLQEHTVNLMITDIRMPGCDGMELIQKAQVLNPDMHFIIISGYSQFDYAQQAIRYGVEDYLLKPIRKKDLTATLKKILDKYAEEVQYTQKRRDAEMLLKQSKERMKRSLLDDILKRPEKFGGFFVRERINEEYHYDFCDTEYLTMMVKLIPGKRREDADTRKLLRQKGLEIITEYTEGICHEIVLNSIGEGIYGIFNGSSEVIEQIPRKLKKVKLELLRLQDMFEDIQVYIALGGRFQDFRDILQSFRPAEDAMQERFYCGSDSLLHKVQAENGEEIAKQIIDNSFKKRFLNYIEIIDLYKIENETVQIAERLKRLSSGNGKAVAEVYKEILSLFYFGTHSYSILIPDQYSELLCQLELYGTIEEAIGHLKDYMITSLRHWLEEKKYIESKPIRIAKRYIGENYYLPLTLEMVSKEIGFNPTYFSGMFKKETEMNFSEYLKEVRIENAKTLLLNTSKTVEDISYDVGYADNKYFSRLFKKLTGVTPTEFRKLYN